jgi:hypothetical protein
MKLRARHLVTPLLVGGLLLGAVPSRASGTWLSTGVLTGSTAPNSRLSDYQWDVQPHAAWGAQALAGHGRFSAGLRGWSAGCVQNVSVPGNTVSPRVRWTSLEAVGRVRLVSALGVDALATAGGGRMRLSWDPDRLTVDAGGVPVVVAFHPVDEWIGGGGLALTRPIGSGLRLGMEVERRYFALDTAHRNGATIEYARQSFGDWSARLELAMVYGLR